MSDVEENENESFTQADIIAAIEHIGKELQNKEGSGWTKLHEAASTNNVSEMTNLLRTDERAYIESRNDWERTPLHIASSKNSVDVVKLLLQNGAQKDALDKNGASPLHSAVTQAHMSVIDVLIDAGVDVNLIDKFGNTSLMRAALTGQIDICRKLVAEGALLDCVNDWGDTALHYAAQYNHANVAKFLLKMGCDYNIRNQKGKSAHEIATSALEEIVPIAAPPKAVINKAWGTIALPILRAAAAGVIVFLIMRGLKLLTGRGDLFDF